MMPMEINSISDERLTTIEESAELATGTVIDSRFTIISVIGKGATGVVYQGLAQSTEQVVAIKILEKSLSQDQTRLRRFQREAKAIGKLQHDGIVRVICSGASTQGPYIVMEFVCGVTLKDVLLKQKRLSSSEFLHIFRMIASALAHAHANGILHLDVKPANIIVISAPDEPVSAKLVDFGLARILSPEQESSPIKGQETSSVIAGTPTYMSPEQCTNGSLDYRSDIYSLGCVMYECATGRPPFQEESQLMLMQKQLNEPVSFRQSDAVSHELQVIIERCLEKRPQDRYQSASELEQVLAGATTTQIAGKRVAEKKKTFFLLIAALVVISCCIAMSMAIHYGRAPANKASSFSAQSNTDEGSHPRRIISLSNQPPEELLSKARKIIGLNDLEQNPQPYLTACLEACPKGVGGDALRIDCFITQAEWLVHIDKRQEARRWLTKAQALLKNYPELTFRKAALYYVWQSCYGTKDPERALSYCNRRIAIERDEKLSSELYESLRDKITFLYLLHRYKDVCSTFNELIEAASPEELATVYACKARLALGVDDEKTYVSSLALVKGNLSFNAALELTSLGQQLLQRKRYREAIYPCELAAKSFARTSIVTKEEVTCRLILASSYLQQNKYALCGIELRHASVANQKLKDATLAIHIANLQKEVAVYTKTAR